MEWYVYGLIAIGAFIVLSVLFRRQLKGLFYDYLVDGLFSTLDNFVGGLGLVGIDIGDWIAAIIIFTKERKVSGPIIAGIVAWEATNFIPFSLIPGVGEGIEIVFNLFPAVTLSRIFFAKYGKAGEEYRTAKDNAHLAESFGLLGKKGKKDLKSLQQEAKQDSPRETVQHASRTEKRLAKKLMPVVQQVFAEAEKGQDSLRGLIEQAPPEVSPYLEEGLANAILAMKSARQAVKANHFQDAIALAEQAKSAVQNAIDGVESYMESEGNY